MMYRYDADSFILFHHSDGHYSRLKRTPSPLSLTLTCHATPYRGPVCRTVTGIWPHENGHFAALPCDGCQIRRVGGTVFKLLERDAVSQQLSTTLALRAES